MSTTAKTNPSPQAVELPRRLRWRSSPLSDAPRWSWVAVVGLVAVGLLVRTMVGSSLAGLLAVAASAASMWRFFLPVDYEISADGIAETVFGRRQGIPWSAVSGYLIQRNGFVLLRTRTAVPLDAFRAHFIPFGPHKDLILQMLARHIGRSH